MKTMPRKTKQDLDKLTDLETKFLYIWFNNGFNATQAYKLIKPDVSDETAGVEGCKLLKKPRVTKEVELRKLEAKMKADIKTEEIVGHLKKMIADCATDGDRTNLLKALEMMNKMAGNYVTKVQSENINHNIINWVEEKTYEADETE